MEHGMADRAFDMTDGDGHHLAPVPGMTVYGETIYIVSQRDINNIAIQNSNIRKIHVPPTNVHEREIRTDSIGPPPAYVQRPERRGRLEYDTPNRLNEDSIGSPPARVQRTERHGRIEYDTPHRLNEDSSCSMSSGWLQLSDQTYMCNLEPLKEGAQVYKGRRRHEGNWHDIAVKLLPYDETSHKEAQRHQKVGEHPNIIRMYDVGVSHQGVIPLIYIAMELCSQTLKDFVDERKHRPLDFQQYFDFAKQIVSGVAFIHKSNILHRDIKLDNILLSPTKDSVRVANLGLSKLLVQGHSLATVSFRGVGSDGFRAPELLHDKPVASFHSDSFSIGIVLAMLFSNGQHPFGPDPSRWRTNISDNKPYNLMHLLEFRRPFSKKRELLIDLVKQCLQRNPKDRPTPEQMLQHGFFLAPITENQVRNFDKERLVQKVAALQSEISNRSRTGCPIRLSTVEDINAATGEGSPLHTEMDNSPSLGNVTTAAKEPPPCASTIENCEVAPMSCGAAAEIDNITVEDQMEQFLLARKEQVDCLEKEMAEALRRGQADHLQILDKLKEFHDSDGLDTILQLAEYALVSKKSDRCFKKVQRVVSDAGFSSALDIRQKGYNLQEQRHFIQALILYKISHNLHKDEATNAPHVELEWIKNRITDITAAIDPLIDEGGRSREVAKIFGIKYMLELIGELRAVTGADPCVKALHEISCLVNVTGNTNHIRDHETCIEYGEEGVTMMKKHFGDDAILYKDYGRMLNNLGNAYGKIGKSEESMRCYSTAIESHKRAKDYENDEKRQKDIDSTTHNMSN